MKSSSTKETKDYILKDFSNQLNFNVYLEYTCSKCSKDVKLRLNDDVICSNCSNKILYKNRKRGDTYQCIAR